MAEHENPASPRFSLKDSLRSFGPVIVSLFAAVGILTFLFRYVNLQPAVEENFFFSNEDPQLREDKKISAIFPQTAQIILSASGDLASESYQLKVKDLSDVFAAMPEVLAVQSLSRGPDSLEDAMESELWRRTLIAKDKDASFIFIFLKENPTETFITQVRKLREKYQAPDFRLMISGGPYIVEMIRRSLFRDLQVFSVTALAMFSLCLLFLFRSYWIVGGTVVSSLIASALALIANQALRIQMGFLTSNLSTIVFVLTLSHITFLTADWKQIMDARSGGKNPGWKAARQTFEAALWSTATALLGFLSLFFVQAKSLRQFGAAGSIGVFFSLIGAYAIYPWFLDCQKTRPHFFKARPQVDARMAAFFKKPQGWVTAVFALLTLLSVPVLSRLNTDPSLFTYFRKGGEIREGLEYIDKNGGSNILNIVVSDPGGAELNTREAMRRMWELQEALEKDPAVGSVVSIPLLLNEAKRSKLAKFLTNEWLLDIMESPRFGEIAKYFITSDRKQALFTLRMKEGGLQEKRLDAAERVRQVVTGQHFKADLIGGIFVLQGRLASLVNTSLISGGILMNAVILLITWFLSRSLRVAAAMLASLYFVPAVMFGVFGLFRVPIDIISAPAVNLALGMGVDSMIHMVIHIRRKGEDIRDWKSWAGAREHLLEPILWSTLVVSAGFAVFMMSNFPPTQRFGAAVMLGTLLTPVGALFTLPYLGGAPLPFNLKRKK
ncbi:MAG TPA: MMPL family transporter [Verrucomicrobiae bacterium]|nr:MMPL family transporter [Verrucomicrobiae bacterium]